MLRTWRLFVGAVFGMPRVALVFCASMVISGPLDRAVREQPYVIKVFLVRKPLHQRARIKPCGNQVYPVPTRSKALLPNIR